MRRMNRKSRFRPIFFLTAALVLAFTCSVGASAKFTKETGKKCLDCHSKIPKKGEANLYLTEYGKKFKENGNKVPEKTK